MTSTMACWGSPRTAAPGMLRGMGTHQAANRKAWTGMAPGYAGAAERQWAATEPTWGTVGRPERELGLLGDVRGLDVLELGCGTAYWSAWLQRRGAHPIGLDVTPAQLATARRMQATHGQRFPLLEADSEAIPLRNGCVSDRLRRDWRTPRRIEWADDGSIEFQRPAGEWITLLRGCGFEVERLEHLLADPDAEVHGLWVDSPDWPRRWPPEEVWLARLRG